MISAVGSGFHVNSVAASYKAGVPAVDASLNEGKSQGWNRAIQHQTALTGGVSPASGKPTAHSPNQSQGPALDVARDQALGRGRYSEQALMTHFLVQASNYAPGPKPTSSLIAERAYRDARSVIAHTC
ncbi:hypothetical protein [Pseudophaeobacter flagellatus]|uniref:hypothetical protein n=1 Tax=Pseudophaeobacter flagellatus TaxID=2899119 RepID=UPI001E619044|nr:hypothetical protein [Pseudophaeobacter flagellatus]MCD9148380.1 hypothetical protein [Pseudophaeobacter flagellatus]